MSFATPAPRRQYASRQGREENYMNLWFRFIHLWNTSILSKWWNFLACKVAQYTAALQSPGLGGYDNAKNCNWNCALAWEGYSVMWANSKNSFAPEAGSFTSIVNLNQSLTLQIGICLFVVDISLFVFIFLLKIWSPFVQSLPLLYSLPQFFCFLKNM